METPNIGYLFYKDYYKDNDNKIDFNIINDKKCNNLRKKNEDIIKQKLKEENGKSSLENKDLLIFSLKTTYPGLLLGSGYMHGIGNENEFKIGFFFDYTTGLPIIQGSSIKGLLRSAFKHSDYIEDLLKEVLKGAQKKAINISNLEKEIFEGIEKKDGKEIRKPMYERDIFFDAEIDYDKNEGKVFLGDDFITPHKDPLKNPVPLRFLKVKSEIVFNFRFNLKEGILTVKEKENLFKQIILDLGLGAKTNVGYGQFEEV